MRAIDFIAELMIALASEPTLSSHRVALVDEERLAEGQRYLEHGDVDVLVAIVRHEGDRMHLLTQIVDGNEAIADRVHEVIKRMSPGARDFGWQVAS